MRNRSNLVLLKIGEGTFMTRWAALFRGINVGGKHPMPMKRLVNVLQSLGFSEVRTYIQSGNAVFTSPSKSAAKIAQKISTAVEDEFSFRPHVVLLTREQFLAAIENNPFPAVVAEPKSLHFYFLENAPTQPDLDGLKCLAMKSEQFQLVDQILYLHAPDGIGRSKLAAAVEKRLGVPTTARNYSTVNAIASMLVDT